MPLWTPSQIATALWLDGSDASTLFDATTGGSLVAADGTIARWEDKSGNARHATQATVASRPVRKTAIQNGRDIARFDGTNDTILGSVRVVAGNAKSVYVVARSTNAVGNEIFQNRSGGASNLAHLFRMIRSGGASFVGGDTQLVNVTISHDFSTTFQSCFVSAWSISSSRLTTFSYNGGLRTTTGTVNSETTTGNYRLGSALSTGIEFGFWPGDICELVVLANESSVANRELMEGYLAWKWDTVTALDASHPYKSAAPRFGGGGRLINGTSLVRPAGNADNSSLIIGAT